MNQPSRRDFIRTAGTLVAGGAALATSSAEATQPQPAQRAGAPLGRQVIGGSPYPIFSRATRLSDLVFISGVLGQKPGTRELASDNFEPQCRQAMENLKASIEAADSSLGNVLKCNVYLTSTADFPAFDRIYEEYFPKDPPARTSVVVKELPVAGAKVGIDCFTCL